MLNRWPGGDIKIEFIQGPICFFKGRNLCGRIILEQKEYFKGTELVLTLVGKELTDLKKSEDDFGVAPTDTFEFFSGRAVLRTFEGHVAPAGHHEYEFELQIPDWLPTSTLHNTEYCF